MEKFRKMRRIKSSRPEECEKALDTAGRGTLAVVGDGGYPYCVPVNFLYDGGRIYIHGCAQGHKADAIAACDKVCFTVTRDDFRKDGDWAWYATSVVAFGRAKWVEDREKVAKIIRLLAAKYYPSQEEIDKEIARDGHRVQLLEIKIEHMTAKQVHEK